MMCKDFSGPPPPGPVSTAISDRSCRDQRGHGASRLRRKKRANNQQHNRGKYHQQCIIDIRHEASHSPKVLALNTYWMQIAAMRRSISSAGFSLFQHYTLQRWRGFMPSKSRPAATAMASARNRLDFPGATVAEAKLRIRSK